MNQYKIAYPLASPQHVLESGQTPDTAVGPHDLSSDIQGFCGYFPGDQVADGLDVLDVATKGHCVYIPNGAIKSIMHADTEPKKIANKFIIFSNLPKEIRLQVWEIAIYQNCGPRFFKVTEYQRAIGDEREHPSYTLDPNGIWSNYYVDAQREPRFLLAAGKEARNFALASGIYQPLHIAGASKAVFFSPNIDVFRLSTCSLNPNLPLSALIDVKLLTTVKNLDLTVRDITYGHVDWMESSINSMEQLRSLTIRGTFFIEPQFSAPTQLQIFYEKDSAGIIEPVFTAFGIWYRGEHAYGAISHLITDPEQIFWLRRLHRFLVRWEQNTKKIPEIVWVQLRYP